MNTKKVGGAVLVTLSIGSTFKYEENHFHNHLDLEPSIENTQTGTINIYNIQNRRLNTNKTNINFVSLATKINQNS